MSNPKETSYLLFAPEREGADDLVNEITQSGLGTVKQGKSLDEVRILVSTEKFDCLLLNLRQFRLHEVQVIEMLRSLSRNLPIVATARYVDEDAYKKVKDSGNLLLLQKPFKEAKIIALFASKLSEGKRSFKREFWRYPTQQQAVVEIFSNNKSYAGTVTNISRGGALFESHQDLACTEREMVTLKIQLNEIGKIHVLKAEIAWHSGFDEKALKCSLGLKFLDPTQFSETIYSKLKA
jgi:DNA-binding response OmpR family regulator